METQWAIRIYPLRCQIIFMVNRLNNLSDNIYLHATNCSSQYYDHTTVCAAIITNDSPLLQAANSTTTYCVAH